MIVDVVYGFLGAGKTTFVRRLLDRPPKGEKLVVLVNEFGEVGLDGLLLAEQGADIVEMPSGCICCTMSTDFRRRFMEIHEEFSPDRIVVEPTGVATISQIQSLLEREDLRPLYSHVYRIHVQDASEFLHFMKSHRHFMINQVRGSNVVVLNKTDLVEPNLVRMLVDSIKEINPDARVFPTTFALLDEELMPEILGAPSPIVSAVDTSEVPHGHEHAPLEHGESVSGHDHDHNHDHNHEEEDWGFAGRYASFGRRYSEGQVFEPECLIGLFEKLIRKDLGMVVRAKGVFRVPGECLKLEIASGQLRREEGPRTPESVVSIIGQFLNTEALEAHLRKCLV